MGLAADCAMTEAIPGPTASALCQLNRNVFNKIVAYKKLPFVFNNIVARMCSLLFLNHLVGHARRNVKFVRVVARPRKIWA